VRSIAAILFDSEAIECACLEELLHSSSVLIAMLHEDLRCYDDWSNEFQRVKYVCNT